MKVVESGGFDMFGLTAHMVTYSAELPALSRVLFGDAAVQVADIAEAVEWDISVAGQLLVHIP